MAFNINDMRSQLSGGGASPTLFQVQISNPVNGISDIKAPFMIKAASLPGSTLGTKEVPYMGRKIKQAGDRTFEPWNVTVINDEDFLLRNAFEEWSNSINSHEGNLRLFGSSNPNEYKTQAQIVQFGANGVILREYTFHGLFPSTVEPIETSWESTDTIEEFSVTLEYDWWSVSGGITGNAGT